MPEQREDRRPEPVPQVDDGFGAAEVGLADGDLAGIDLVGVDLVGFDLVGIGFADGDQVDGALDGLDFVGVDLVGLGLAGVGRAGLGLADGDFAGVDLAGLGLTGAGRDRAGRANSTHVLMAAAICADGSVSRALADPVGVPDSLGSTLPDGEALSLGVVEMPVGVGVRVPDVSVGVGDGIPLPVGSGIVGPPGLSAGFGVSDSDGVGLGTVVGAVVGAEVGRCGGVVALLGWVALLGLVDAGRRVSGLAVGSVGAGEVDVKDAPLGLSDVAGA